MKIKVETMCDSLRDCIVSEKYGADRIELNSGSHLGGLTPSLGLLIQAKTQTNIPVLPMIRCRMGGFTYSDIEYDTMYLDAKLMLENGADGIVYGFLNEDRSINIEMTKKFTDLAKEYKKEAIFHRAFDRTQDPYTSIETLIDLRIDRILTSGLKENVTDGLDLIKDLQEKYGDQIEILPGSGITHENAKYIIDYTKTNQIHGSFKELIKIPTSTFTYEKETAYDYQQINPKHLKEVVKIVAT